MEIVPDQASHVTEPASPITWKSLSLGANHLEPSKVFVARRIPRSTNDCSHLVNDWKSFRERFGSETRPNKGRGVRNVNINQNKSLYCERTILHSFRCLCVR